MKSIIIIGAGGFAREVLWLVENINRDFQSEGNIPIYQILGFVSDTPPHKWPEELSEFPLLGDDDWAFKNLNKETEFIIAAGDPKLRERLATLYLSKGFQPATLIHPSVIKSPWVEIGEGSVVCAGTILTTQIHIGRFNILNLNVTVGHDFLSGDFVTISPGANISGKVTIESNAEIGSGAIILPGKKIGKGAVVGAGAVVTHDVAEGVTVKGIPAR